MPVCVRSIEILFSKQIYLTCSNKLILIHVPSNLRDSVPMVGWRRVSARLFRCEHGRSSLCPSVSASRLNVAVKQPHRDATRRQQLSTQQSSSCHSRNSQLCSCSSTLLLTEQVSLAARSSTRIHSRSLLFGGFSFFRSDALQYHIDYFCVHL